MASIRLKFTDFPGLFNTTRILKLLSARFDVNVVECDPDYLIYSVFGCDVLSYPDAVRIFYTGENVSPDFSLCDYAFAFDWLEFGDRYYRWPNYQFYEHYKELCLRRRSNVTRERLTTAKPRFCNFIYSNPNAIAYRDELLHAIARYRPVDSAGPHLNNVGFTPGKAYKDDWPGAKVDFQRGYKFSIACENSSSPGYTTEKIVHALAADTIPIYFGNPVVAREFNTRRIINCHEFDSLDAVVKRVAEVDNNDDLYLQIVSEPFFPDDQPPPSLADEALLDRFSHIFAQPKASAFRRNRNGWGALYEDQRRREAGALAKIAEVADRLWHIARPAEPQLKSQLEAMHKELYTFRGEGWQ